MFCRSEDNIFALIKNSNYSKWTAQNNTTDILITNLSYISKILIRQKTGIDLKSWYEKKTCLKKLIYK